MTDAWKHNNYDGDDDDNNDDDGKVENYLTQVNK